jgi:hypothetical protein
MKCVSSLIAITTLVQYSTTLAFAPSSNVIVRKRTTACAVSRRDFFSTAINTSAAVASGLVLNPLPSVADVSDGNALPQGAAQFSRVIKVRAQLKVRNISFKSA